MAPVENGGSSDREQPPQGADHWPGSASPSRPPLVKPSSTPELKGLTLDHVDQFLREEVGTPIVEADDVQFDMLQRYGPQRSQPFRVEPYPLPSLPTHPVHLTSASVASLPRAPAQSTVALSPPSTKASWQPPAALAIPKQAKYRTSSLGNNEPMYQPLSPDNPTASPNPIHQEVQASPKPNRHTGTRAEGMSSGNIATTSKHAPPPTASPPVGSTGSQGGKAKATHGPSALPTSGARTPNAPVKSLSPSRAPDSTLTNGINAHSSTEPLNPHRQTFRPSSVGASDAPAGPAASETELHQLSTPTQSTRHRRASTGDKDDTVGGPDETVVPTAVTGGEPTPLSYDSSPGLSAVFLKRNADFHMLFKEIPISELLIDDYGCALQRDILVQGRLYITESYICFHANIFGWITHLVIQFAEIVSIEKRMTALIIPNAIQLSTLHTRYFFASFIYRDAAYSQLLDLWKKHHPCKISTTDTSARRMPSARTSEDVGPATKAADGGEPGALGHASTEVQHESVDFTETDHSYSSDDSDWSGSSYTDGYSDSNPDASDDDPTDSWDAGELGPPGDQHLLHSTPGHPESPALGAGNSVTATTSKLARTIQRLVQRSDEPSVDDNGVTQFKSASGSSTTTSGTPTYSGDPATFPLPHNQSEANLSRTLPAKDGPKGLVRSRSAHRSEPVQSSSPADGNAASPNSTRFSGKRVGHGASSVSNVYATHVVTRSNRSAMLTTGAQSGRHSPAQGQVAVPRHSKSAPHAGDPMAGTYDEAEESAPDDKTAAATPKSSTAAPDSAAAPVTFSPPTPTTCACLSAHEHYDYLVVDEVLPCALPVMYRLLFDGSTPPGVTPPDVDGTAHQNQYHSFMLNFLMSDKQNNKNVQYSGWQPGTTLPENTPSTVYNRAIETRSLQYIRPINAPIGPKSTKCELTEICLAKDFDRAVVVDSTTCTPDVPSGSCFHTKARVCLMHAGDFKTRLIASHKIVWTKSSWIKGAIEKGSIDGNNAYFTGLRDFLRQFLAQHQEFMSLPNRPARGLQPPTSKANGKPASRSKEPRDRHKRAHRRHHRGRRSRKHAQGDDLDALGHEHDALLQQAAQVGQRATPDPSVLERTTNPLFRWVYSWFPLVTPSQLETTIKGAPLPAKVLSSAEAVSSTLAPVSPTIHCTATMDSKGTPDGSPSTQHGIPGSQAAVVGSDRVQSYGTEFSYWLMSFLLCLGLALLITISGLMWLEMRTLSAHLTTLVNQQSQLLVLQQPFASPRTI
ncbi:hypothetical protein H4R34_002719 [Dimargaris verticillata]|uniref:VASt domain-containing protein n=1 Tax=Dimargaris verticillata TaxID=2761393 RepID=A0A9W8EDU7_9FUNG|nr:hypothetical protein H4R34_002719 [Dimargaris verticillata]